MGGRLRRCRRGSRRPWRAASRTIAAALALGAPAPTAMMSSSRRKPSIWRRRCGVSDISGKSAVGKLVRRAILLQELRNNVFADDEIGEDHARQVCLQPDQPRNHRLEGMQTVGRNCRHAGKRQLERHRAGRRERDRALRNAAHFSAGSTTIRGWMVQPATASRSCEAIWGTVGSTSSIGPALAASCAIAAPNMPGEPPDLADRLPGNARIRRRIGKPPFRLLSIGPQFAKALDQRMADIGARRPAEPRMDCGLERQDARERGRHKRAWRAPVRAARPKPTAKRNRGSGIDGARRRTRRATRCVKSGLSIMTRASGRASTMACAVSRMRRKMVGNRRGMAVRPMIDSSSIAKWTGDAGGGHGAAADAGKRRAHRLRARGARGPAPPRARRRIPRRRRYRSKAAVTAKAAARASCRNVLAHADKENPGTVGRRDHLLRFRDHRAAGGDGKSGKTGLRDILDREWPN